MKECTYCHNKPLYMVCRQDTETMCFGCFHKYHPEAAAQVLHRFLYFYHTDCNMREAKAEGVS